jgi:hypothetical protein
VADHHTVRRARVPFQKDSPPNRTAEEREWPRPLTYPEERRDPNRIAEGERCPSPATWPRIRAPRPERVGAAVLLGSSASARVHERPERAKGEAGPCHRTCDSERRRIPPGLRGRSSLGTPTPRGSRSSRAPYLGHLPGAATRRGRTGRRPLHCCRPQGASKRFVGRASGVCSHPRGRFHNTHILALLYIRVN